MGHRHRTPSAEVRRVLHANDRRYLTNQESTGSELIVPVLDGGAVVGTLDIEDERTGAFTADDQALFEDLADALRALYR